MAGCSSSWPRRPIPNHASRSTEPASTPRRSWRVISKALARAQSRLRTRAPLPSRSPTRPACLRGITSCRHCSIPMPTCVCGMPRATYIANRRRSTPTRRPSELAAGDYFVQALFDSNADLRLRNAPGNLYSKPKKIHFDPAQGGDWKLELTEQVPAERLPAETAQIKFINIQSKLLSHFYNRPIFLRAGILLPRDYDH